MVMAGVQSVNVKTMSNLMPIAACARQKSTPSTHHIHMQKKIIITMYVQRNLNSTPVTHTRSKSSIRNNKDPKELVDKTGESHQQGSVPRLP